MWRVDDALWRRLAPLLAVDKPRKKPGRPRHDDRPLFNGVIWVLRTGAQWDQVPAEFGPKSTVHLRFQEWVQTGALQRAWQAVLRDYDAFVGLDLHWQAGDGCLVKAPLGQSGEAGAAEATGRNPTDRGKTGTKRHVLTAANGVPIAAIISEANRTDMKKLGELLDALLVSPPDLPEDAPDEARPQLTLDRGYDYDDCRDTARAHGYVPHIPRRASKDHPLPAPTDPQRHPPRRWVVEITQLHYH